MGEPAIGCDHQEWFNDPRGEGRRLRVSWHRDERLVVLSLWQGGACTGTFRMPVEDAARLIGALAADLADAVTPPVVAGQPTRWRDRMRAWFQRPVMAPVVPLRGRHRPGR